MHGAELFSCIVSIIFPITCVVIESFSPPSGDIERLQKFWLHGACRPKRAYKRASEPLALEQFLSAYLLLLSGVVLALLLLVLEHVYFKYLRKHLAKKDSGGCCALISLVSTLYRWFDRQICLLV